MTARTGQEYISGLRDNRTVWLGGEKVDVLKHPAFAGSVNGMAAYFDWQHKYADDCLVADPETGKPMNASLIVPRNADDLRRRHAAFDRFARYSNGMLGRTPDYVNVTLAGFVARSDIFTAKGDTVYAERIRRFYRRLDERLNEAPELARGGAIAGLPLSVIDRAKTILAKLESDDTDVTLPASAPKAKPKKKISVAPSDDSQLSLL